MSALCPTLQDLGVCHSLPTCPFSHEVTNNFCFDCGVLNIPEHEASTPHKQAKDFHRRDAVCPVCNVTIHEDIWAQHAAGVPHGRNAAQAGINPTGPIMRRVLPAGTVNSCETCCLDFVTAEEHLLHHRSAGHRDRVRLRQVGLILRGAITRESALQITPNNATLNLNSAIERSPGAPFVHSHIDIRVANAAIQLVAAIISARGPKVSMPFSFGTDRPQLPLTMVANSTLSLGVYCLVAEVDGSVEGRLELKFRGADGTLFIIPYVIEALVHRTHPTSSNTTASTHSNDGSPTIVMRPMIFVPPALPSTLTVRLCENLQRHGSCPTRNCPESHYIEAEWCFQCNLPIDDEISHLQSEAHAQALQFNVPEPCCPLCEVGVDEKNWEVHTEESGHKLKANAKRAPGEEATIYPVWKRVPSLDSVASCEPCTVDFLDLEYYNIHCHQDEHHLRMKMAQTGRVLREALTTKGHVSVSHESGVVDFGEIYWEDIEAGTERVTTHIKVLATSTQMTLLAALLHASSENKALGHFDCGFTEPIELEKSQPVFVPITFRPKKSNGKFADKLDLTIMRDDDEGTTFTVQRDVEASVIPRALSPVETRFPEALGTKPSASVRTSGGFGITSEQPPAGSQIKRRGWRRSQRNNL